MTRYIIAALILGLFVSAAPAAEPVETLPPGAKIVKLAAHPPRIELKTPFEYTQLLLTGQLATGEQLDVTRLVKFNAPAQLARVNATGVVRPVADGGGVLKISLQDQTLSLPVEVKGQKAKYNVSFVRDVMPTLSRIGCNAGTCHGAPERPERLQTVAARLRSALRSPLAHRRPQGPALQPGRSRYQPHAAQMHRHRRPRRRCADAAGRAVLRSAAGLDRRRRQARSQESTSEKHRSVAQERCHSAAGHEAADRRLCHVRRRQHARCQRRGVSGQQQYRGGNGQSRRHRDGRAPRRDDDARRATRAPTPPP